MVRFGSLLFATFSVALRSAVCELPAKLWREDDEDGFPVEDFIEEIVHQNSPSHRPRDVGGVPCGAWSSLGQ